MKQRLKLLHCTGRIPAMDLDTGKLLDWIALADSEIILDTETGYCEILPDGRNLKTLENIKKHDLLDDSLEKVLYRYRWNKVEGNE